MKALLFTLLTPVLVLWTSIENLDQKNGFGIYIFGSSPNTYKDLYLEIQEGNTTLYSSDEDYIKVDGVKFDYVRVTFIKNKLAAIAMGTKDKSGFKMYQYLIDNFGKPLQLKKSAEWNGSKVQLSFEKTADSNDAVITLYSKEIYGDQKPGK
ncbi:MAG: hypothetical protein JST26_01060 [Bacteroidetes bacterium]|nr:hypothetical protein [Bacteroidota bacterium]